MSEFAGVAEAYRRSVDDEILAFPVIAVLVVASRL